MIRDSLLCVGLLVVMAGVPAMAVKTAPPLPPPPVDAVYVSTPSQLQNAIIALSSGGTIVINPGTYDMSPVTAARWIQNKTNITFRGATDDPNDVVLVGTGMSASGAANYIFQFSNCDGVTVANLTMRDVYDHLVHVVSGSVGFHMYNCRLIDCRTQFVKVQDYSDAGIIEYCHFEFTDRGPDPYNDAIDCINYCDDWIIRDNTFLRMRGRPEWTPTTIVGATILMWRGCEDTLIERNEFIECDWAVQLGNPSGYSTGDHIRGIIRNNFFYRSADALTGDTVFSLNFCIEPKVYNNTCIINGTFPWTIEARYSITSADVFYNLCDGPTFERNDATINAVGNVIDAGDHADWFVDFANGDLHLTSLATGAIDQAGTLADVTDDFDWDVRPVGSAPDIGADEYVSLAALVSSEPAADSTLSKVANNVIELTFDAAITGPVLDVVAIGDSTNLAGSFAVTVAPDGVTCKAVEAGTVLANQTWYRITPAAGFAVQPFTLDVCKLIGDANGDRRVMAVDLGVIWSHNGQVTDARYDINGDGRVMAVDLGVAWGHNGEVAPARP